MFSTEPLTTLFFFGFALICPGMLWIAVFRPDLFAAWDTVKVLTIAIASAAPIVSFNTSLTGHALARRYRKLGVEEQLDLAIYSGGCVSIPVLFVPVVIRLFWANGFGIRGAFISVVLAQLVMSALHSGFVGLLFGQAD